MAFLCISGGGGWETGGGVIEADERGGRATRGVHGREGDERALPESGRMGAEGREGERRGGEAKGGEGETFPV